MTTSEILKGFLENYRGIGFHAAFRSDFQREAAKQIAAICSEMPPAAAAAYCADQAEEAATDGDLHLADIFEKAERCLRRAI